MPAIVTFFAMSSVSVVFDTLAKPELLVAALEGLGEAVGPDRSSHRAAQRSETSCRSFTMAAGAHKAFATADQPVAIEHEGG